VMTDRRASNFRIVFPLSVYYATTLGLPILNGAYRQGIEFWEHSLFVLVLPVVLVVPVVLARFVIRVLLSCVGKKKIEVQCDKMQAATQCFHPEGI